MNPLFVGALLWLNAATATPPPLEGPLEVPGFRIHHTAAAKGAAAQLAEDVTEVASDFRGRLGRPWPGTTDVRVGVGRREFEALALGPVPSWAVALAYPDRNLVVVEAGSLTEPDGKQTLLHELSHVALGQLGRDWPRWFQEGLAVHLSGELRFRLSRFQVMARATGQDRVFRFDGLSDGWPQTPGDVELAYAQSEAFVGHLSERFGPGAMGRLLDAVGRGATFEQAFREAFGQTVPDAEAEWRSGLKTRFPWFALLFDPNHVWWFTSLLFVFVYLRFRHVRAHRRVVLEAQEAAEEAAMRIHLAEAATEETNDTSPEEPPPNLH